MSDVTDKNYYLHTINGKAGWFEGNQIVYCYAGGLHRNIQRLASDLKQIKREQKATNSWRLAQGFSVDHDYGYVRVRLP